MKKGVRGVSGGPRRSRPCNTAPWDTRTTNVPNAGKLAVFNVLLSIGYDRTKEAACALEAEMVRFHMRIAFSIPEAGASPISGFSLSLKAIFG